MVIIDRQFTLGIELGSTRIKSVLIDEKFEPVCVGSHEWTNRLEDGVWTYHIDDVWAGVQTSYADLAKNFSEKFGENICGIKSMGVSGMMHGYLPMDNSGNVLAKFRTWRNTNTHTAAEKLTKMFNFNIPLRWSIAHLYQSILNEEPHVGEIAFITTLAGYVHYKITGQKVLGVGEASGMFPIDSKTLTYNSKMMQDFNSLVAENTFGWDSIEDVLPVVLSAGTLAGMLTKEGALLIDPTGGLNAGISLCPPEGDAGTGMVATHSVACRTGNVSAGTSIFAMLVLEDNLSRRHEEIDMVTTPDGKPVAMVHCNNGTSDLDAWVSMFHESYELLSQSKISKADVYRGLYQVALEGDAECGLMACNYLSGEHNTGFTEGRPLFVRMPNSRFNLANFMRTMLLSSMATLNIGMDILRVKEGATISKLLGHGGFFATKGVAQKLMAGMLNLPVAVMETANEGGAWGIALLAAYLEYNQETLDDFLDNRVFADRESFTIYPDENDAVGFAAFMDMYKATLLVERTAVDELRQ